MTNASPPWRAVATILLGGVVLAGCGTATGVVKISGIPSISIAVPLRTVACTTSDACVAAGATTTSVGPSTVGEDRRANGGWRTLAVPNATSALLATSSCWDSGCLLGGTQTSGDLVWRYDALARSITPVSGPARGRDVSDLSCFASSSCALVDTTGIVAGARLSFTVDAGTTWSRPIDIPSSTTATVTDLACASGNDCLVVLSHAGSTTLLEATQDAGATWSPLTIPVTWSSVSSLTCRAQRCAALVGTTSGPRLARSRDFGRTWSSIALKNQVNAVACATLSRCVAAGQAGPQDAWLATIANKKIRSQALQYVPSPLTDVACGTTVCAAIGVSTLVTLRP